jgi:nitrite reductase/ring-hydroxylating ferredoxin subunit
MEAPGSRVAGRYDPRSMSATLVPLCDAADVSEDQPRQVERDGETYAVFQAGGAYYVTADQCTHGPGFLSEGAVIGLEVECPFHQGRFDLRTGAPTAPPCFEPVRVWIAHLVDGRICIDPYERR